MGAPLGHELARDAHEHRPPGDDVHVARFELASCGEEPVESVAPRHGGGRRLPWRIWEVAGAGRAAGSDVSRTMTAKRACARPDTITAWTPTDPTPSTRVVQCAGLFSSSCTYCPPPTAASISRMAAVERGASSMGSYLLPTFTQGRRSLATANSMTSVRASSRSIWSKVFMADPSTVQRREERGGRVEG